VAIAAHPDVDYVMVTREDGLNDERLILAKDLMESVFGDTPMKVLKTFKGRSLKGRKYAPLFTFMPPEKPAHYVVTADYVTVSDGTGLVHTAPAFGADDMATAKVYDLPTIMTVDDEGNFKPEVKNWAGQFVKDADPWIIKELQQRGLMFNVGKITHTYPFCWRCFTWLARVGSLKPPRSRTAWWNSISRSTGTLSISRTAALATGWRITSTGRWGAIVTGGHPCQYGNARNVIISIV
jgi:isoleucyl-tRNA synthetase